MIDKLQMRRKSCSGRDSGGRVLKLEKHNGLLKSEILYQKLVRDFYRRDKNKPQTMNEIFQKTFDVPWYLKSSNQEKLMNRFRIKVVQISDLFRQYNLPSEHPNPEKQESNEKPYKKMSDETIQQYQRQSTLGGRRTNKLLSSTIFNKTKSPASTINIFRSRPTTMTFNQIGVNFGAKPNSLEHKTTDLRHFSRREIYSKTQAGRNSFVNIIDRANS